MQSAWSNQHSIEDIPRLLPCQESDSASQQSLNNLEDNVAIEGSIIQKIGQVLMSLVTDTGVASTAGY